MMALNQCQSDALTELINIAFGLTAAKLSEITGRRVLLDPPVISIHPLEVLAEELKALGPGEVAAVHQIFSGPISGDAMLFLDHGGAVKLTNVFVEEHLQALRLDVSTGEILTEVGNMLLGACLGVFGNLLEVRVSFSVPVLHLQSLEPLLASLFSGGNKLRQVIVIATSFRIREQEAAGQLGIILAASSLERLLQSVEVWEGSQFSA
jgi:chemotaxis protein CheC